MWLDSHCHLTADRFDEDRAEVIQRAFAAEVDQLIAIGSGYGIAGNAEALALARSDPRIFAAAGVHPHEASEYDDAGRTALREWLADERVVAVAREHDIAPIAFAMSDGFEHGQECLADGASG